jgi:hypothetical protein
MMQQLGFDGYEIHTLFWKAHDAGIIESLHSFENAAAQVDRLLSDLQSAQDALDPSVQSKSRSQELDGIAGFQCSKDAYEYGGNHMDLKIRSSQTSDLESTPKSCQPGSDATKTCDARQRAIERLFNLLDPSDGRYDALLHKQPMNPKSGIALLESQQLARELLTGLKSLWS